MYLTRLYGHASLLICRFALRIRTINSCAWRSGSNLSYTLLYGFWFDFRSKHSWQRSATEDYVSSLRVIFSSCCGVGNLFKGASESNMRVSVLADTPNTVGSPPLKRLVVFHKATLSTALGELVSSIAGALEWLLSPDGTKIESTRVRK